MDNKTTVDFGKPSLYAEPNTYWYRFQRKLTYKHVLNLINKYFKNENNYSLLEVGTGSGFLISFLETRYPRSIFKGIEYDDRLVDLTNNKLKLSNVVQGNAENFSFNEKFNFIVSLQVIEHLYKPEKMLLNVRNHLNDDGIFLFTTPNLSCLSKRILKNKWHGFREDHVSLKTKNEWDKFLISNGFTKVYSGSTFFTGLPIFNKLPFGLLNWALLFIFGSLTWSMGESYVGVFKKNLNEK